MIMDAFLGALLGGAGIGALISGLVALMVQQRALADTNRHRFTDLKRERYAEFLRKATVYFLERYQWHLDAADALSDSQPLPEPAGAMELEPLCG